MRGYAVPASLPGTAPVVTSLLPPVRAVRVSKRHRSPGPGTAWTGTQQT